MRAGLILFVVLAAGCAKHRASVTAVPLSPWNQCEPAGIPYYLPKPLLVITKNVRHIDESKVGLTHPAPIPNGFDNQAAYADVKANVTVPGGGESGLQAANTGSTAMTSAFDTTRSELPDFREQMTPAGRVEDGVAPDSFFTYQIVFVPDLSQKYGLRIKGGPGEIRAAMNLVNGWMYTGMGPFYLKDSSTAQNFMAAGVGSMFAGRGVADVLNSVSDLASASRGGGSKERAAGAAAGDLIDKYTTLARLLQSQTKAPQIMPNYAEIFIYEPQLLPDGSTEWRQIAQHSFDRHYFQPEIDESSAKLIGQILGLGPTSNTESTQSKAKSSSSNSRSSRGKKPAGQSERGAADGEPEEVAPAPTGNGGGNSRNGGPSTLELMERKALGLPLNQPTTSVAPATQFNLTINDREDPPPAKKRGGLSWPSKKKAPPTHRNTRTRLSSSSDGTPSDPNPRSFLGSSVSSQ